MKILANPVLLRAAVVLFCSTFAFVLALILMRKLRNSIEDDADVSEGSPSLETMPLHVFNTVIQQLKQQKQELQEQSQAEQQRARTNENLSQAVLSDLSSGVLVFGTNGLVKTSNPAAKEILGFVSTTGMSAEDIFRGAVISRGHAAGGLLPDESLDQVTDQALDQASDESVCLADEVDAVLRQGRNRRHVDAEYETPAGDKRFIAVTVSPVPAGDGSLLGVACLINDLSELDRIRREQELQGETSGAMALQLRSSLTTISGYAQQLASNRDPERARQLAASIADEAANLNRTIGGFLSEKPASRSVAAGVGSTSL